MPKVLIDFDNCPNCGGCAEIDTNSLEENYFYDGDSAECCECGLKGIFSCDENAGYINWDDDLPANAEVS